MSFFRAFVPFILSLPLFAAAAPACDSLNLEMFPSSFDFNANTAPTFQVRVTRNGSQACDYFITFDYGTAGSASGRKIDGPGGQSIGVQLYKNLSRTQILKTLGDASSLGDVVNGSFPAGGGQFQDHSYYASLANNSYAKWGFYSQTFTARLYRGSLNDSALEQTRTLTLTFNQQKKIDLSLVPTGGAFDVSSTSQFLNFGPMVTGDTRSCDLMIGYNAGYRLTVSSANNGRLKHQGKPDVIAYTLMLNGTAVNLTGGSVTLPQVGGVSPPAGLRLPVTVQIGSITTQAGGSYRDDVTFSVVSTE